MGNDDSKSCNLLLTPTSAVSAVAAEVASLLLDSLLARLVGLEPVTIGRWQQLVVMHSTTEGG